MKILVENKEEKVIVNVSIPSRGDSDSYTRITLREVIKNIRKQQISSEIRLLEGPDALSNRHGEATARWIFSKKKLSTTPPPKRIRRKKTIKSTQNT